MVTGLPPLALIAGPTASGKSALALALAARTGGVIVNADSAQVYRDLPVLSAAPTEDDRKVAEHRLYGVRDGADACSAADWAAMAREEIDSIHASSRLPILVGGTGLYLRTLLDGIAPVPLIDAAIRNEVRSSSTADNFEQLRTFDPFAASKLAPADTTRVARALEVVRSTGQTLRDWQAQKTGGIGDTVDLRALVLIPPRDWLYRRCDRRFEAMIAAGAVDEVRRLLDRRLNPRLPVMRAIGVPELGGVIRGEWSLEQAITAGAQATRRYAKRQYTWFAHQPPSGWQRFERPLSGKDALEDALALLGSGQ